MSAKQGPVKRRSSPVDEAVNSAQSAQAGIAEDVEQSPRTTSIGALTALAASFFFYWPYAMFHDLNRGKPLGRLFGIKAHSNPQADPDGPEYLVWPPARRFWLYNRHKSGHRGFLPSLLGPYMGGGLQWLVNVLTGTTPGTFPHPCYARTANDASTDEDTMVMTGSITDRATGEAIQGAKLYAWQADPRGTGVAKYGDLDLDYDFRGVFTADPHTGTYAFGSLYPVCICPYSASPMYVGNFFFGLVPGLLVLLFTKLTGRPFINMKRPPHIHFYITAPGYETLTTQLYFPDRLEEGELDAMLDTDVAHKNKKAGTAAVVDEAKKVHPVLSGSDLRIAVDAASASGLGSALPKTKWAARFNFTLDKA